MIRGRPRVLVASVVVMAGCRGSAPARVEPAPPPTLPVITPPVARVWSPREEFVRFADSLVQQPAFRTALWGVLVVDPVSADTIYAHNADKLFLPASNQKLVTGAAALTVLGTSHRFTTSFAHEGIVRRGVLRGNVVVSADGDPSISAVAQGGDALRAFDPLVAALRERGIRRIEGAFVVPFDALPGPTIGSAWEADDLDGTSGAAIDELFFNEGEFTLQVRAGARAGARAVASTAPLSAYPRVRVTARTATGPVDRDALEVGWDSTGATMEVRGEIAPGTERRLFLAYRHPADAWRAAATEALRRAGITITGRHSRVSTGTPVVLASVTPLPFADVLRRMEKPSQNQLAEILYRTVGRARTGSALPDSAQRAVERQLAEWGVPSDHAAIRDGSGLSRHNYLTPTAIVRVLDVMRRREDFPVFYDALPIAGRDGTIANRMKGTPAEANVRAKTGTLDKARALSGYVTAPDGRLLLFSMLCNNWTTPVREVERVQDAIAARLAVLRLDRRE
ncbi:MAG: D-alanyl-D-alanine carboxypeptidase/D-alanyl-D-alanine-endopeptidase [Gemmatimonadaceae bacterium]|jgi:D-alanyl-D-alanine carboxypeptidase/D-alanyl-D-alanine-endopeptidase (penicillin-binding protein 4)|nr:D-alanyl-D-alanine carboxypeptidase/D-alanyl-D-alanine-endopeptidase [Gemmatimonadaceae bacterium]